ncbi:MAG: porphobilinogen synthase [Propionibacteriaceae bacterium]|jgi:porphobilinogen synthase|nr:porphobilinogen synthase [Propionibacteriaceae bacterium]
MTSETTNTFTLPRPIVRPRRLRATPGLRRLVAETRLRPADLIWPLFVKEGIDEPVPISSMPGQFQHTEESLAEAVRRAAEAGLGGVMLFGIPAFRDAEGSAGVDPNGVLQRAIRLARATLAEAAPDGPAPVVMADTCLDEFTDHGHCGLLRTSADGTVVVDNDATLAVYQRMAVAQAEAGAEIVGPSGMMDGQVGAIRQALDEAGHQDVAILAYAAKYASAFYGPFREAVDSTLRGDRRTYQMDPANRREGLYETELDIAEGADIVMVKPAASYLDVLTRVADLSPVPVAAYQVSGEYAMVEAAAANGWINRQAAVIEATLAVKRAGANLVLTYWAPELADWLD